MGVFGGAAFGKGKDESFLSQEGWTLGSGDVEEKMRKYEARNAVFLTALRHPVSRALSRYWYEGRWPMGAKPDQQGDAPKSLEAWMGELRAAVAAAPTPPLLLCHSLGCTLAAHYLAGAERLPVAGAFLVAPPDMDAFPVLPNGEPNTFRPLALRPLGVPATVIMSASDPYTSVEAMRRHAEGWGAERHYAEHTIGHALAGRIDLA